MRAFPKAIVFTTKSHFDVKKTYASIQGVYKIGLWNELCAPEIPVMHGPPIFEHNQQDNIRARGKMTETAIDEEDLELILSLDDIDAQKDAQQFNCRLVLSL